jgi:N-acetylglutamate synthase-like GNAT family acetyltransferase
MIRIESARAGDLVALRELLSACGLPLEGVADAVDKRQPLDHFVVATEDIGGGRPLIGCAGLEVHGTACVLRSLAVDPKKRGRGVARLLIEEILRRARDAGCRQAFLLTTTIEPMAARYGFSRIERTDVPADLLATSEFALNACSSATVMRRSLRSHP